MGAAGPPPGRRPGGRPAAQRAARPAARVPVTAEAAAAGAPASAGLPDLDDITLETLPHARRGLRLTLLELAAWLAHEPHSDAPVSVSPVLATYARWFASALDDHRRQTLKDRARRLVGTASTPAPRISTGPPAPLARRLPNGPGWPPTGSSACRLPRGCGPAGLCRGRLPTGVHRADPQPPRPGSGRRRARAPPSPSPVAASSSPRRSPAPSGPTTPSLVEQAAWDAWEQASEAGRLGGRVGGGVGGRARRARPTPPTCG